MSGVVPPEWQTKIMHGSITLGGFRIFLEPDDPADAERLFNALAENGTIEMPLQQTFWSVRFGVLTDQFGIPWTINCAQGPEPTP